MLDKYDFGAAAIVIQAWYRKVAVQKTISTAINRVSFLTSVIEEELSAQYSHYSSYGFVDKLQLYENLLPLFYVEEETVNRNYSQVEQADSSTPVGNNAFNPTPITLQSTRVALQEEEAWLEKTIIQRIEFLRNHGEKGTT